MAAPATRVEPVPAPHPRVPRIWDRFRAGSLLDRGPVSLRHREIVIDRTCARCGCGHEWGVHVAFFAQRAAP